MKQHSDPDQSNDLDRRCLSGLDRSGKRLVERWQRQRLRLARKEHWYGLAYVLLTVALVPQTTGCRQSKQAQGASPSEVRSGDTPTNTDLPPAELYRLAQEQRRHGNLRDAELRAEIGYERYLHSDPELAGKFRILQYQMLMALGTESYESVLRDLAKDPPQIFATCDLRARRAILQAYANRQLGKFDESQAIMRQAEAACKQPDLALAEELATFRGHIGGTWTEVEHYYRIALDVARRQNDSFPECGALIDMAEAAQGQQRYDEAIDYAQASLAISQSQGYRFYAEKAEGLLAFNYYKLGDFDRALQLFKAAAQKARETNAGSDRIRLPNNLGLVYEELGQLDQAESSYREALGNARQQGDQEQTIVALADLAYVSIRNEKWDQAESFATEAFDLAHKAKNQPMELEARLAQGLIAAHHGDQKTAEAILSDVARSGGYESESARWEAQAALANLYAKEQKLPAAQAEYLVALNTVRDARCSVKKEALRLPFFANATRVYDSYIDFLVEHGKSADALRTADESRALTLAEGLGVEGKKCLATEAAFNPQRTAKSANATILFYWLGGEHSYLWAVAADRTKLYPLPPAAQIEPTVQAYRKSVVGSRDALQAGDANGAMLYETLVAPAEEFFQPVSNNSAQQASSVPRIVIIAEDRLSGLNFETLIDRKPNPHYWIEDVSIENASSLRLLSTHPPTHVNAGQKLLLIGNPVIPKDGDFEALPNAAREMKSIGDYFSPSDKETYEQGSSTPVAYLNSRPEQFAYIHFVAHGTASLVDPLDSAVVLSPPATKAKDDEYKLYARDVMTRPLKAELVTVSACKGAGVRTYTGEGLVGLSWAFLHAGAHHVIGALWDVSDEATPQLMAAMYAELIKGTPPEAALRTAKLSLLHSGPPFRKPYYWAAFQMYTGS